MEGQLVKMCIEAATESAAAVEKWRRQRRSLERLPSPLAESILHRLNRRRILYPSLLEVFQFSVEDVDLRGESYVDAEWMAYLGGFRYLRSLVLADCHRINDSAIWSLTGLLHLKEVDLSRCSKITDAGIRHLLTVPTLEKLYISETGVTAHGVSLIASLTYLLVLDLGGLPVNDSALSSLQSLTRLEHLDLWGSSVSNKGAVLLKTFPRLNFLNLAWTGVTNLPNLPSLSCLNMSNCNILSINDGKKYKARFEKLILSGATVSDVYGIFQYLETDKLRLLDLSNSSFNEFGFLPFFKGMTHLNLSDSSVDDDSVQYIACVGPNLSYLNLSNTRISSDGIGALAGQVPNLETILLAGTCIDDRAVLYISMMPSLKVIDLSNTYVRGLIYQPGVNDQYEVPSFPALKNLSNLERLDLEGLQMKVAALTPLANLEKLSRLSLKISSLTDETLYTLASVPNLTHLGFREGVLTDAGLDFPVPPKLEYLDLRDCWLLTEDAILSFCQKHPQIEVKHEFVTTRDKRNSRYSTPSQETWRDSQYKRKLGKFPLPLFIPDEDFVDQRLKYSRDELLAMQFSSASASMSSDRGNLDLLEILRL